MAAAVAGVAGVAFEEAFAHIAGSSVEACWVVVVVGMALAVTEDIPGASASAWEGIGGSHGVGSHLAAAAAVVVAEAAHTEDTGCLEGHSDSPGAASCIAGPWCGRLSQTVTGNRDMGVALWAKRGVTATTCKGQSRTWVIANARQVTSAPLADRRALAHYHMQASA